MSHKRTGAVGALLDIYENEVESLITVIGGISEHFLKRVLDPTTDDPNCRSIQSILTHVVHAGFGYAVSIRKIKSPAEQRPEPENHPTISAYILSLHRMFTYTEDTLQLFTDNELRITENKDKIMTGWHQQYDPEQLMEHAIVHIMRHQRQIENLICNAQPFNQENHS
ncbi:MAG: DinB family protein [Bacteroidota bacterium]|nr:DinB family protein [Bacteroidota bacterium]